MDVQHLQVRIYKNSLYLFDYSCVQFLCSRSKANCGKKMKN
jgi:hypothetical protein